MTEFWNLGFGVGVAALAMSIYFLSGLLQGTIGFGSAILASPFLVMLNPSFVPAPIILCSETIAILMVIREVQHVRIKPVLLLTGGRVGGAVLGSVVLLILSQHDLILVFAILLLAAVVMSAANLRIAITRWSSLATGVLSGAMGTIAGIGGVPAAILYKDQKPEVLRSNLAAFFLVGNLVSLIALARIGRLTVVELKLYLVLLPGLLIGYSLSGFFKGRVDTRLVKTMILTISGGAAIWLIIKYVQGA